MIAFERLIRQLEDRLLQALPGPLAHEPMRAVPIGSQIPKFDHKLPPKPGSVLILVYPDPQGVVHFPLIKRPDYIGAHSGQVSLPGGKAEAGETTIETALREANEEIGLKLSEVHVLGELSEFLVIPSNFRVTPVVAYSTRQPDFVPDTLEVSRILLGTLNGLVKEDAIKSVEILAAGRYAMMAPHFEIEGEVVWGATGMMLNEFRVILKEILTDRS